MIDFLISTDSTKLIHLDTFDLTKDPADAIPIAGRPIRGNPAAKVTVINFDDLECPFCARMHQELFPATIEHYKDLVRFVYKDDPLTDLHPWAMHAAVDANCLAAQSGDVYWTYVDYLHAHGEEVTGDGNDLAKSFAALDRIARQEATLGKLDETALDACMAKQDETQDSCLGKAGRRPWDRWNAGGVRQWRAREWRRCSRGSALDGDRPRAARCGRAAPASAPLPATRRHASQRRLRREQEPGQYSKFMGLSAGRCRDLSLNAGGFAETP